MRVQITQHPGMVVDGEFVAGLCVRRVRAELKKVEPGSLEGLVNVVVRTAQVRDDGRQIALCPLAQVDQKGQREEGKNAAPGRRRHRP